ncbi:DUF3784 domain-containing protein [Halobacillus fulvus]|nr:DUF3784 domain-containing protein [Halobacillus fulvus]
MKLSLNILVCKSRRSDVMDTGWIVFSIIMVWVLLIHGGLTYLIVKKQEYSLISGFGNRPDEEQKELIENGYTKALGRVFIITFYLLLLTVILAFTPIPYGFEVGLGVFLLVLMIGIVWVQTFEVPRKRKKMLWLSSTFSSITLIVIFGLTVLGFLENEVTLEQDALKISGIYGEEWPYEEIQSVELMTELPEVIVKSNGFAISGQMKGRFLLEEPYEGALLFVNDNHPVFMHIKTTDDDVFVSRTEKDEVEEVYETIQARLSE